MMLKLPTGKIQKLCIISGGNWLQERNYKFLELLTSKKSGYTKSGVHKNNDDFSQCQPLRHSDPLVQILGSSI